MSGSVLLILFVFTITITGSVVILSKYMDFACTVIDRRHQKNDKEKFVVSYDKRGAFNYRDKFKNRVSNKEIIIDIPFEEVEVIQRSELIKVLKND